MKNNSWNLSFLYMLLFTIWASIQVVSALIANRHCITFYGADALRSVINSEF